MSRTYVFDLENDDGTTEKKYVTLSEEKIEWIIRSYLEKRINAGLPI